MLFSILKFLFISLEVLVLFNLIIFVHELGHFLAAKWRGMVVEKFAIWFGKPIWSRKIGGVEYILGSIPAGGYVALPQMAPMETLEGKTDVPKELLVPVKPLDKIIVAVAGPLFSLGLAFACAVLVWQIGRPQSENDSPVVGIVLKGGPADKAGIRVGDEILEIDGNPVKRFLSGTSTGIKWRIVSSTGDKIQFTVRRDGQVQTIPCGWTKRTSTALRRPPLREVGIGPKVLPGIGYVVPKGLAYSAGFQSGDLLTSGNGQPISSLEDVERFVDDNRGKAVTFMVERSGPDGGKISKSLVVNLPADPKKAIDFGVEWGRTYLDYPDPFTQVIDSATSVYRTLIALFTPKSDIKASILSGPVGIFHLYYRLFDAPDGWRLALVFCVLVNVNLAIMNMLPFPVLDGGHITFALLEMITRRPVNARILEYLQTGCAVLLMGFFLYLTGYDISDFFPAKKPAQIEAQKVPAAKSQ